MKRAILALAVLGAMAFGQNPVHATSSPNHVITQLGTVTTGGFTVSGLSASELSQTGTVVINSNTVTINCVSVLVSSLATHLAGMRGIDTSGVSYFILVRQPTPATGVVLVSNSPAPSTWCAAGDWPFSTPPSTGAFLITP